MLQPEGNGALSEVQDYTILRYLMPIQVKQITKCHKVTCGCEACISEISLHASLLLQRNK